MYNMKALNHIGSPMWQYKRFMRAFRIEFYDPIPYEADGYYKRELRHEASLWDVILGDLDVNAYTVQKLVIDVQKLMASRQRDCFRSCADVDMYDYHPEIDEKLIDCLLPSLPHLVMRLIRQDSLDSIEEHKQAERQEAELSRLVHSPANKPTSPDTVPQGNRKLQDDDLPF